MENTKDFILALRLKGEKFVLYESAEQALDIAIDGAKHFEALAEGAEALVVKKDTLEIQWPERLKGKRVATW